MSSPAADTDEARIKRFLAIASHDLQSPLRHIAMYAEILLDDLDGTLGDEHLQHLKTIRAKAQAAQELTKALVGFAAGAPKLSMSAVDVGVMISDIWTESLGEIDAPDARIEIADLPAVTTDAGVLRQVLRNIVANALVHRAAAAPVVTIAADARASGWTLYISDNGPGIEADVHESIFQPFWSLPREGAEKRIGLGLAAARDLVAALGGSLRLDHSNGSGSRFAIQLPFR